MSTDLKKPSLKRSMESESKRLAALPKLKENNVAHLLGYAERALSLSEQQALGEQIRLAIVDKPVKVENKNFYLPQILKSYIAHKAGMSTRDLAAYLGLRSLKWYVKQPVFYALNYFLMLRTGQSIDQIIAELEVLLTTLEISEITGYSQRRIMELINKKGFLDPEDYMAIYCHKRKTFLVRRNAVPKFLRARNLASVYDSNPFFQWRIQTKIPLNHLCALFPGWSPTTFIKVETGSVELEENWLAKIAAICGKQVADDLQEWNAKFGKYNNLEMKPWKRKKRKSPRRSKAKSGRKKSATRIVRS